MPWQPNESLTSREIVKREGGAQLYIYLLIKQSRPTNTATLQIIGSSVLFGEFVGAYVLF